MVLILVRVGGWLPDNATETPKGSLLTLLKAHKLETQFKTYATAQDVIVQRINGKEVTTDLLVAFYDSLPPGFAWKSGAVDGGALLAANMDIDDDT